MGAIGRKYLYDDAFGSDVKFRRRGCHDDWLRKPAALRSFPDTASGALYLSCCETIDATNGDAYTAIRPKTRIAGDCRNCILALPITKGR